MDLKTQANALSGNALVALALVAVAASLLFGSAGCW